MSLRGIKQGISQLNIINTTLAKRIENKRNKKTLYDLFKEKIEFLNNNVDKARVYIRNNSEILHKKYIDEELEKLYSKVSEYEKKLENSMSSKTISEYFEIEGKRYDSLKEELEKSVTEYNAKLEDSNKMGAYKYIETMKPIIEEETKEVQQALAFFNLEMEKYNQGEVSTLEEIVKIHNKMLEELEEEEKKINDRKDSNQEYFLLEEISVKEIENTGNYGRVYIRVKDKVVIEWKDLEGVTKEDIKLLVKEGWEVDEEVGCCEKYIEQKTKIKEKITPWGCFEYRKVNKNLKFELNQERAKVKWKEEGIQRQEIIIYFNDLETPITMIDLDKEG